MVVLSSSSPSSGDESAILFDGRGLAEGEVPRLPAILDGKVWKDSAAFLTPLDCYSRELPSSTSHIVQFCSESGAGSSLSFHNDIWYLAGGFHVPDFFSY